MNGQLITAGVVPAQAKESDGGGGCGDGHVCDCDAQAEDGLTGVFEYTHEIAASVADIESALRLDLADAVKSKMSDLIVNGDGSGDERYRPKTSQGFLGHHFGSG